MPALPLTYAPHPIFAQTSTPVEHVDDGVRQLICDMFDTLRHEDGIGMAAPMVGIAKRIIVVDLRADTKPLACINPHITKRSQTMQTHEEASLCFPGISAPITRPESLTLHYLDAMGEAQEMEADGFLATVIQHEVDYLDGITYLDHLSRTKRDMLLRKMKKHQRLRN